MRRLLALGDSYTIGESVAEDERWPVQLAGLLARRGIDIDAPEIIAATGWTTADLDAGIDAAASLGPYDLVTLLIGVNNQYRGLPLDEYHVEIRGLLARAMTFVGGEPSRVIVLSIPDWGVTPVAGGRDRVQIAREIDAFNAANREEAASAGSRYVDVTESSRQHASLLAPDGLHPSGEMYRLWAELVLPDALAALGQPG